MNTSGERDRSREESGSEEDPLTKTSPPGDQNHQRISKSRKSSDHNSFIVLEMFSL